MKITATLFCLLAMSSVLFLSNVAFAQDYANSQCTGDECDSVTLSSILTTTGATTVVTGIGITVRLLITSNNSASKEAYLRQNAVALKQDLTVGAGDSIDDLAAAFQVSEANQEIFAAALHTHRAELLPLTDVNTLNKARADAFFECVARLMHQTPALHQDFRRIIQAS